MGLQIGSGDQTRAAHFVEEEEEEGDEDSRRVCRGWGGGVNNSNDFPPTWHSPGCGWLHWRGAVSGFIWLPFVSLLGGEKEWKEQGGGGGGPLFLVRAVG